MISEFFAWIPKPEGIVAFNRCAGKLADIVASAYHIHFRFLGGRSSVSLTSRFLVRTRGLSLEK